MVNEIGGLSDVGYLVMGTASMLIMMLAIIGFMIAFQRKLTKKNKAYQEIEKLMQKQELRSAYALITGQEEERKRIAAELHDNIGGLLATLNIYSDLVVRKADSAEIAHLNIKINDLSSTLVQEVRKLSHKLDLRTLSGFGLGVAVEQLCEAIARSGKVTVTPLIDIQNPIDDSNMIDLYRIIQELFTNTLKHSHATHIRVEVTQIEDDITLIYEDNGRGFDVSTVKQGMGMDNILSRVNRMHAKLTLDSSSNGTTYIIELNNHV